MEMGRLVVWSGLALALGACGASEPPEGGRRAARAIPSGNAPDQAGAGADPGGGAPAISAGESTTMDPSQPGATADMTPGDDDYCADAMIEPKVTGGPGNLLVIFDRSSSMNQPFQGTQARIDAVHEALEAAIAPFLCPPPSNQPDGEACAEKLTVAAILFPSSESGGGFGGGGDRCNVDPLTADTQIDWQLATPFIESWRAYWQGPYGQLVRGTPIPAAFREAEAALSATDLTGTTTVLFLTDGESNCDMGVDPVMQATTWAGRGIQTYVVSVAPGVSTFNEQVAQAGGTDQSITPTDTQQLTDTLSDILQTTVQPISCLVELEGTAIDDLDGACDTGRVLVGPTKLACDPAEGFQIRGPHQIEIMGTACDRLMTGTEALSAQFPCQVLVR